jgi:hypothetical protein
VFWQFNHLLMIVFYWVLVCLFLCLCVQSAMGVRQDIRLLVQYKRRLLQKILNKLQILKEMNYFGPNKADDSFPTLFAKV